MNIITSFQWFLLLFIVLILDSNYDVAAFAIRTAAGRTVRRLPSVLWSAISSGPSSTAETSFDEIESTQSEEAVISNNKQPLRPIRRYGRSKKEPLIAIVGRPNVGKSALVSDV